MVRPTGEAEESWARIPSDATHRANANANPDIDGTGSDVGAFRNPVLPDGGTANETLTEYTVGQSFAYEATSFTNILGRLVEGVRGEWTFTPDGEGTVIRWTYELKPRCGRYSPARRGLAPLWRHYMQAGIEAAAKACE
jgi:hypothetical protein